MCPDLLHGQGECVLGWVLTRRRARFAKAVRQSGMKKDRASCADRAAAALCIAGCRASTSWQPVPTQQTRSCWVALLEQCDMHAAGTSCTHQQPASAGSGARASRQAAVQRSGLTASRPVLAAQASSRGANTCGPARPLSLSLCLFGSAALLARTFSL